MAAEVGTPQEKAARELIIKRYQELMKRENQLQENIISLGQQELELRRVEEILQSTDPKRVCYRRIHEVLAERTVADVLPEITSNHSALRSVISKMQQDLTEVQAERVKLQKQHGIQIVPQEQVRRMQAAQQGRAR